MEDIKDFIAEYQPLNELEQLFKILYMKNISLDRIDYESKEFWDRIIPEKNLSREETKEKFKHFLLSMKSGSSLSTDIFIPKGRSLYIRKFPRYMPDSVHHHKDALEIDVVLQGVLYQNLGEQTIRLNAGDICIIAPNVLHSTKTNDDQSLVLSVIVYQDVIKRLLNNVKTEKNDVLLFLTHILYGEVFYPYLVCQTGFDNDLIGMVIDLEHSQDIPGPYTDRYIETGLKLFLLRLLMLHKDKILLGRLLEKNDSDLLNLLEYIKSNYKSVTLDSLAMTYNYSPSYLSTLIKSVYGRSFKEIVTQFRLEQAVRMLCETDYSMAKIADTAGYTDKSYFLRCFKKQYGMTPLEYKAKFISG